MPRGKKWEAVNPLGYACVNVLVQKAIGRVITRAKYRVRASTWHKANKERANQQSADRHKKHREHNKSVMREYHHKHRAGQLKKMKLWRCEKGTEYYQHKRATDPAFVVAERCRDRLNAFLASKNGAKKANSTMALVGCSAKELHRQLYDDCNGRDFQECEIDHVFPFASFKNDDLDSMQRKVMHRTNVQPLTVCENRNKWDKLPTKAMAAKVDRSCWPDGVTEDMLPEKYPGWSTPLRM